MELNYDPNQPLNLKISLLMGQAFRWRQEGEWFSGVAQGHFIKIRKMSRKFRESEIRNLWKKSKEHFGPYAGYAGQFLFHEIRSKQPATR